MRKMMVALVVSAMLAIGFASSAGAVPNLGEIDEVCVSRFTGAVSYVDTFADNPCPPGTVEVSDGWGPVTFCTNYWTYALAFPMPQSEGCTGQWRALNVNWSGALDVCMNPATGALRWLPPHHPNCGGHWYGTI